MSEIQTLQPSLLWKWFDQICAIPHPSYYEEQLASYVQNWAKGKGFYAERDEVGNLLIRKPATAGMENRQKVALQAHFDMVPQANENSQHNFQQDPILPYIDGEWVKAKGTTLGADNGIGMASALAVLDADDIAHPELEVLLTMTEEAGMEGAMGLRSNWLQSDIMINTDTEEEGEIYIGCAGGEDAHLKLPLSFVANNFKHSYQISLKGLSGGHSGVDIHTGRVNAVKLLACLLAQLQVEFPFVLSDIRGGSVRNAIPREAFAVLNFNAEPEQLNEILVEFEQLVKQELAVIEPNLTLTLSQVEKPVQVLFPKSNGVLINLLNALPNGVLRNSDVIKGVVETSLSLGVLNIQDGVLNGYILMRSLIESGKDYAASQLASIASLAGASVEFSGSYPGWQPQPDTPVLALTEKIYSQILGKQPAVKVIHAGLECGLIKKVYPAMEMVSIGPTIRNAHSPDEQVKISAVQTYWKLLTELLANIPAK